MGYALYCSRNHQRMVEFKRNLQQIWRQTLPTPVLRPVHHIRSAGIGKSVQARD